MFQKVISAGIWGIDGFLVAVEADIHDGLPGFLLTGNLSQETREAQERVRTALKNADLHLPPKKITVNLAPADIRKEGTAYDLAIAAAVLGAFGIVPADLLQEALVIGEVGLNGEVKPVRGVLSLVSAAKEGGLKRCFLPRENALEGSIVTDIEIIPVGDIPELVAMLTEPDRIVALHGDAWRKLEAESRNCYGVDFAELNGQPLIRRATEIAVAGRHNILYVGSAGTGKTMAAKRIPTIMPPLSREESIQISKIYSISGLLPPDTPLMTRRPFRSPHHTITPTALAGGGVTPRPGEITLASNGVLFLDELPEFSGKVIEILRQPLEDRMVTVSRLHGSYVFPANTMLAAAANPCPCGFYPDRSRCHCSPWQIKRYIGKISKPILDRIDITVEAAPITYEEFRSVNQNESSAQIRERVIRAQEIQYSRFRNSHFSNSQFYDSQFCDSQFNNSQFNNSQSNNSQSNNRKQQNHGNRDLENKDYASDQVNTRGSHPGAERLPGRQIWFNGEMGAREIEQYCKLGPSEEAYLKLIYQSMKLSARACHKILKVARTIADLDGKEQIEKVHLSEAVSYRSLEEKYWG